MAKGTGTLRSEIVASIYTNVTKDVAGDTVQERLTDAIDSLSQGLYDNTIPYEAGESKIFEADGVKTLYLCLAGTTPGESPSTTPAKWESVKKGVMQVAKAEVLFSNTSQTTIITLPEDAVIWNIGIETIVDFNGSGSDLLDIGIDSDSNYLMEDANWLSIAFRDFNSGLTSASLNRLIVPAGTPITFTYKDENSDASTGQAFVYIHYSLH